MSDPARAVFLSYAHDDAAAARRIADALRSAGIEVWFDENELRGGDSWDAKIRQQIDACALFIPIISTSTQERNKGYFRLEWKLAVDQTHLLAAGVPFIAPVVVDGTTETAAIVPPEFMRVQWTRLTDALPTPNFVAQIKRLLDAPVAAAPTARAPQASPRHPSPASPPRRAKGAPAWIWPLAAVVLAVVGYFGWQSTRPTTPAAASSAINIPARPELVERAPSSDKSIAVLPFANMSEDKDNNAFFADGVHEDILTNLAYIHDLRVVSRTSVLQYRGTTKTISEIARELKVTYVLEGSVRRAGNKIRVTGQLIRAANDEHVWAKAYDRDLADVFAVQSELAQAIAGALKSVIAPETKALLSRRLTDNPEAYDAYLKARQLWNSSSTFRFKEGEVLLQQAVALDPDFAAAWAAIAGWRAFNYFDLEQTPEQLALAKAASEQAMRLAPDDPEVIQGMGDYYYYGYRDYGRAAGQYLRMLQMRPNDASVIASLGFIKRRQGRIADSVADLRRATELEPPSGNYAVELMRTLMFGRRFAEAEMAGRRYLQAQPDDFVSAHQLALIVGARGSDTEIKLYAQRKVAPDQQAEFHYYQLAGARAVADWPEAIRLDRAQRYYDPAGSRGLQDVQAAATFAEADDLRAALLRAAEAVEVLNAELSAQPLNAKLWAGLSLARALLGDRAEALRCGDKARALMPESRDAFAGVDNSVMCASALAYAGETDRALAEFERLLHVPFGTSVIFNRGMLTGSWKPLRDDPRFQALLNDPKNNQPLF